jgi:hypothetical protein
MVYHELWDKYHPYIGDKATLYYLFLLRYRDNKNESYNYGKSWRGRKGVIERFQLSYSTLPLLDKLLSYVELVDIETRPSHNGADKIFYTVNDPLPSDIFEGKESLFSERIKIFIREKPDVKSLVGKEKREYLR